MRTAHGSCQMQGAMCSASVVNANAVDTTIFRRSMVQGLSRYILYYFLREATDSCPVTFPLTSTREIE